MKHLKWLLVLTFVGTRAICAHAQIDSVQFFLDEKPLAITLTTDYRSLQTEKKLHAYQPATVEVHFPDSTVITEDIRVAPRGHYRRTYCTIPPLWLNFHNPTSPKLSRLGNLKLVLGCASSSDDEQLILKEFTTYKIYNLLDEKSYRVRLVKVTYHDTRNKVKPFSQFGFFVENDKALAKRNHCVIKPDVDLNTESTNRALMTKVALFEYMISNGDWSVLKFHNIHVIYPKENENVPPYPVPYDFDHSGFVNAGYALPPEIFGTETVRERVYRGFPRTMEELQTTLDVFRKQKDNIVAVINNCPFMKDKVKKDVIDYLGEFYSTISSKNQVQSLFIDNARKD